MYCTHCGTANPDDFRFCVHCGKARAELPASVGHIPDVARASPIPASAVAAALKREYLAAASEYVRGGMVGEPFDGVADSPIHTTDLIGHVFTTAEAGFLTSPADEETSMFLAVDPRGEATWVVYLAMLRITGESFRDLKYAEGTQILLEAQFEASALASYKRLDGLSQVGDWREYESLASELVVASEGLAAIHRLRPGLAAARGKLMLGDKDAARELLRTVGILSAEALSMRHAYTTMDEQRLLKWIDEEVKETQALIAVLNSTPPNPRISKVEPGGAKDPPRRRDRRAEERCEIEVRNVGTSWGQTLLRGAFGDETTYYKYEVRLLVNEAFPGSFAADAITDGRFIAMGHFPGSDSEPLELLTGPERRQAEQIIDATREGLLHAGWHDLGRDGAWWHYRFAREA